MKTTERRARRVGHVRSVPGGGCLRDGRRNAVAEDGNGGGGEIRSSAGPESKNARWRGDLEGSGGRNQGEGAQRVRERYAHFDRAVAPAADELVRDEVDAVDLVRVSGEVGLQLVALEVPDLYSFPGEAACARVREWRGDRKGKKLVSRPKA